MSLKHLKKGSPTETITKKWQRGHHKQSVALSWVNQLTLPSGVVTVPLVLCDKRILLPATRLIYLYCKTSWQRSCASPGSDRILFLSSENNSPIWILMRKTQNFWLKPLLWCFPQVFIQFAKKGKTENLFPTWFLCTVNTSNIWCDSCFVKEMRKKKGSRGDCCFDLSCINTLEENTFLHPDHQSCQFWEGWQLLFPTKRINKSGDGNLFFFLKVLDELMSFQWRAGEERENVGSKPQETTPQKRVSVEKERETCDGSIPTTDCLNWDR